MSELCQSICQQLETSERRQKIAALEELQVFSQSPNLSSKQVLSIFDECYLHVLKCYADRYESVRDQAVNTVNFFIEKLPPNDFHLLNIISTLTERMGKQETVEESEEIRLLFVTQLNFLFQHYIKTGNSRSLVECYPDIVRILTKGLRDKFPDVQREACACVVHLASAADTNTFQKCAAELVKSLYSMLNHKHSQARIAAIKALSHLALHIDASGDDLSRLFMEVSPLLMDSMPLVRRECGLMGVLLLMELKDRYSYFDRIIPLVLCCLKDDSPDVVDYIRPLWVKCGKQYYEENEEELKKQEIADHPVKNYPIGVERPTIGCRGLVQRSLRLLKLITRESSDWKENVRLHSLKLLYQFVLHAEAAMTAKFFEIYHDMSRACCDNEPTVMNEAFKVADLMGRLLSYDDWHEHGFNGITKNAKEGYLKCFYYMFTAAIDAKNSDILRASCFLIEPEFSQSLKPEFQKYVLKLVQTLIKKSRSGKMEGTIAELTLEENTNENLFENLYIATIKVMALSFALNENSSENLTQIGNDILEKIAESEDISTTLLHEKYFLSALSYVQNLDAPLDSVSEPILLLYGLISICQLRSSYLKQLESKINDVWQNSSDDAKVKIFSIISIVMLNWHATIGADESTSIQLLLEFVQSVVEQHLLWKVGANAEAMRSLATATLCAMSQGAKVEARSVLPTLVQYFPSLIEDRSVSTRIYAIKCLNNFGEVNVEDLRKIAYATLQRLDDPSGSIREAAATVIPKLTPKFQTDDITAHEQQTWICFLVKAHELLFLHLDCPETRVKLAIKASLLKLAGQHPEVFKNSFKCANSISYNNVCLMELLKDLPFKMSDDQA